MENKRIERRKGPDKWIKSLTWFGTIGWIFMIVTFAIFHKARPESETSIVGFYQDRLGKNWDADLVPYFVILSAFILILSTIGLIVNSKRHNRRNDKYRLSLILLVIISILGLVYYLI